MRDQLNGPATVQMKGYKKKGKESYYEGRLFLESSQAIAIKKTCQEVESWIGLAEMFSAPQAMISAGSAQL